MSDILADLRAVQKCGGNTYSSAEVVGMVGRGADEIERLRALILDGCKVFIHYDLPEHAFHYQRALERGGKSVETGKAGENV